MTGIGPDLAGIATVVRVLAARPELRAVFPLAACIADGAVQ
jgi:hypothetical protein